VADRVIKLVDGHITSDALVKESLVIGNMNTVQEASSFLTGCANGIRPLTFAPGETVIGEGNITDKCYYIESGTAELVRKLNGRNSVMKEFGPGTLMGEMVLLKPTPRTATIRASDMLSLMELSPPTFTKLIQGVADHNDLALDTHFY